jgi:hypothetical protein
MMFLGYPWFKIDLQARANGRILEILQDMWKTECEKEEKKSLDRWRYKEIWLLDYVRKYGNSVIKERTQNRYTEKHHKRLPGKRTNRQNLDRAKDRNRPTERNLSYAEAARQETSCRIYPVTEVGQNERINTHTLNCNDRQRQNSSRNILNRRNNHTRNNSENSSNISDREYQIQRSSHPQSRMCNIAGTTYIGKRVPHYFLGGGKSSQGERFWYNNHYQLRSRWIPRS